MEEYRNVVINGKLIPDYMISNYGNVYNKRLNIPVAKKIRKYITVKLTIDSNIVEEDYTKSRVKKDFKVHRLVMAAFKPMNEFPPIPIDDWNILPDSAKRIIEECIYINHIDHDPKNNCIENLEYATPRENARKAIIFYKNQRPPEELAQAQATNSKFDL